MPNYRGHRGQEPWLTKRNLRRSVSMETPLSLSNEGRALPFGGRPLIASEQSDQLGVSSFAQARPSLSQPLTRLRGLEA